MPRFQIHIGIDYSGAATPETRLRGIRVAIARQGQCELVRPGQNWSRREVANWLLEILKKPEPMIVGIDHGFSFPISWFETHGIRKNWGDFLEVLSKDFPADQQGSKVDDFRKNPRNRPGNARWRRQAEIRCEAKSVFHFGVPGSVAKSTHAGIPWLNVFRKELGSKLHFWPFDGFRVPDGKHVLAEAYPSLWRKGDAPPGLTADEFDALTIAKTLSDADDSGELESMLQPELSEQEKRSAEVEGWILGVR
jgi:hypothetical protein